MIDSPTIVFLEISYNKLKFYTLTNNTYGDTYALTIVITD